MAVPERLKQFIGHGRCIKFREMIGGNLIYNPAYDQHRAIFIHIPKTAGTSVGEVLFPGNRSTHYRWDHYQSYCANRFQSYFKFTFVRNPFDRLVSAYVYLNQGGKSATNADRRFYQRYLSPYRSFEQFVHEGLSNPTIRQWGHFAPQSQFIAASDGTIMVDFVGRVEQLDQDFQTVAEKLKIKAKLKHVNATKRKHYSEYYDAQTEQIVREHYATDLHLFNYQDRVVAKCV